MFAVHNSNGMQYRGTLEEISRKRTIRKKKSMPRSALWDSSTRRSPVLAFTSQTSTNRYKHAEELYRSMLRVKINETMIHAHQVMSSHVYTLSPDELLMDALRRFDEFEVKQMPVLNEEGEVISLVGESDIRRYLTSEGAPLNQLKSARVSDICPKEVITAEPVASIRRVAKVLGDYQQSGIPIVDNTNQLVGFISSGDILRTLASRNDVNYWC